jgi:glutathione S-transferase
MSSVSFQQSPMKLTYFDVKARGEAIRWAMILAEIPFDDNRISFAQWAQLKENEERIPYGTVPVLELADGTCVTQSAAILKYVGKLAKLYPEDTFQQAKVDEVVALMHELMEKIIPIYFGTILFGKDEDTKREEEKGLEEKTLPYMLGKLERVLAGNKMAGVCVGDGVTIADIQVAALLEMIFDGMMNISSKLLDTCPRVQHVVNKVQRHPKMMAYFAAKSQ